MSIALTSQEKKVLGFVVLMVVLGLVVLGIKGWTAAPNPAGRAGIFTHQTAATKAP